MPEIMLIWKIFTGNERNEANEDANEAIEATEESKKLQRY